MMPTLVRPLIRRNLIQSTPGFAFESLRRLRYLNLTARAVLLKKNTYKKLGRSRGFFWLFFFYYIRLSFASKPLRSFYLRLGVMPVNEISIFICARLMRLLSFLTKVSTRDLIQSVMNWGQTGRWKSVIESGDSPEALDEAFYH